MMDKDTVGVSQVAMRIEPVEAARQIVQQRFPDCLAAFVAGSVLRGEGTSTSDLDMVIITTSEEAPFRESIMHAGWPVELFVHTAESYPRYFEFDAKGRTPALAMMCLEGRVVRDTDGLAGKVKDDAQAIVDKGPAELTQAELETSRYFLTDLLDDLIGATEREELLFIAPAVAAGAASLILDTNRKWSGKGKWLLRSLRSHDATLADELTAALDMLYVTGSKDELVDFCERALAAAGGRYFEGYRMGGRRS